jgi:hypothetical protein
MQKWPHKIQRCSFSTYVHATGHGHSNQRIEILSDDTLILKSLFRIIILHLNSFRTWSHYRQACWSRNWPNFEKSCQKFSLKTFNAFVE